MKPDTSGTVVTSTMSGETIAMGIAVEDMAHIMSVLTDLYSNRLRAVVREYSTNALDAHVEAGVSLPIEVSLPSTMQPFLKIRDYGIGLDAAGIRLIYSQYGASTKRATNDQVGMLGLGCKSALTYTSQFTVVSVKNGARTTVLVSRNDDGAGQMEILGDAQPTDDASGTEIIVAIRREDVRRAADEAADFFQYWDAGTVLVNGRPPKAFDKGRRVSPTLFIQEGGTTDTLVMGGVPYPCDFDVALPHVHYNAKRHILAFVPIGTVKPAPSREALMDVPLTRKALAAVKIDFEAAIAGTIQREISAAQNGPAAIEALVTWGDFIPAAQRNAAGHTWRGTPLPKAYTLPDHQETDRMGSVRTVSTFVETTEAGGGYGRKGATSQHREVDVTVWPRLLWVTDFEPAKFNASHKNKLLTHIDNAGLHGVSRIVLVRPGQMAPDAVFVAAEKIVPWATIKAIRLTNSQGQPRTYTSGRLAGSYDCWMGPQARCEVAGSKIDEKLPIYYVHNSVSGAGLLARAIHAMNPAGSTLVCLGANRIEKFKRDVPQALNANQAVRDGVAAWVKAVPLDQRQALTIHRAYQHTMLAALDATKVADPALKAAIAVTKLDIEQLKSARDAFASLGHGRAMEGLQVAGWQSPIASYPLWDRHKFYRGTDLAHLYLYLNAAFAAKT